MPSNATNEPQTLKDAFALFFKLPTTKRDEIVRRFEEASPAISINELADSVAKSTESSQEMLRALVAGLAPIVPDTTTNEAFRFLVSSLIASGISLDDQEQQLAQSQIQKLLQCEKSLGLTGKVQTISWSHGNVLEASHIITEIRPVFYSSLQHSPEFAVIMHNLRIDYRDNNSSRSLSITMDSSQIKTLQSILARAIEKEQGIRENSNRLTFLAQSGSSSS